MDNMIGQTVRVIIDRPLGSIHPKHRNIVYPINYGYIEGVFAPDGEEHFICKLTEGGVSKQV